MGTKSLQKTTTNTNEEKTIKENKKILIVDDNVSIHEEIKAVLLSNQTDEAGLLKLEKEIFGKIDTGSKMCSFDYEISSAYQGEEALKMIDEAMAKNDPYVLIFMDIRMPPGINGIETILRIRKKYRDTEIVICTAFSDFSWEQIVKMLGEEHNLLFLKKPFDSSEIQQVAMSLTKKWNLVKNSNILINSLEDIVSSRTYELEKTLKKLQEEIVAKEAAQLELDIQRSKALNSAKLASLGEIAGGVAHEINNPLTVIINSANSIDSLLKKSPEKTDVIKKHNDRIINMSVRAGQIVRTLKNLSRNAESDPFETTNVNDIIVDAVSFVSEKFKEFNVDLRYEKNKSDLMIECRKVEISQTILNLLNNSFDAIVERNIKWVEIETKVNPFNHKVQIIITDSGEGIPENIREKIMQPFFTTKDVGSGTGLGLSISKSMVEGNRGTLEIDFDHPHTRFIISLPAIDSSKI